VNDPKIVPFTFIYSKGFTQQWQTEGLTAEELRMLEMRLMANPEAGSVIAGTGGLRKLRISFGHSSKGKSGGGRIGYAYFPLYANLVMVLLYAKDERVDIEPSQKSLVKGYLATVEDYIKSRKRRLR
jgi:hypothetical protein